MKSILLAGVGSFLVVLVSHGSFLLAGELPQAKDVKIDKLFEVPHYCEGIVFDHAGNGYISHGKVITKFTPDLKTSTWAKTGEPNGHKVLADGTHLLCDASHHAVLHLDARGKILGKASAECNGKALRGPNDLCLDPKNGGFYFTDPGGSDDKKPIGTVHYVDAKGKTHLVADGLAYPNGIVLRPDGKTLLVAESKKNRVLAYPILAPGMAGLMKVFADLPTKQGEQIDNQPDGMCLDEDGNLYVAHYGMKQVQVLDPQGKLIRRYPGGNLTTSNVGFGGPKMNQLYITGALGNEQSRGALFRLELRGVRGLVILPKKKAQVDPQDLRRFEADIRTLNKRLYEAGLRFGTKIAPILQNMAVNFKELKQAEENFQKVLTAVAADFNKLKVPDTLAARKVYEVQKRILKIQDDLVYQAIPLLLKIVADRKLALNDQAKQVERILVRGANDEAVIIDELIRAFKELNPEEK